MKLLNLYQYVLPLLASDLFVDAESPSEIWASSTMTCVDSLSAESFWRKHRPSFVDLGDIRVVDSWILEARTTGPSYSDQSISNDLAPIEFAACEEDFTATDPLETRFLSEWFAQAEAMVQGGNFDQIRPWADDFTDQLSGIGIYSRPGIYPLNGSCVVRLREPLQWKWTLEWQSRLVGRQYIFSNRWGEGVTSGLAVHNIHAGYRWSKYAILQLSVLNVLNRTCYEHNSLIVVDRIGKLGVAMNPGMAWFASISLQF